jgi:hypothetical protein
MDELNLLDPGFLANPYPVYHRLRTAEQFGKSGYQALIESRFGPLWAAPSAENGL